MGGTQRGWPRWALAAAATLSVAGNASGDSAEPGTNGPADRSALVGQYRHSTVFTAGKTRHSVATIAPRGAGFSIAWEEDDGNLFGGIAVAVDDVLGAAYTEALNGSYRGKGVLAYRINGGRLDGIRLPSDSATLIQETLEGPPALEGRYAIASSLDAEGRTYHTGFVEIVRQGDTYQMMWYTPARSYEGVGLRIGDVLVASYGSGFAPGIIAYCADEGLLTGVGTYGHVGTVGADRMIRVNEGGGASGAETSPRCRDAIERWNPSLIRG
ncbi:MAG TPA: hypothetical protein VJ822_16535 [Dongiaceae bacterium]|nr:hypothetical protein [Dongiaceae bacterium]